MGDDTKALFIFLGFLVAGFVFLRLAGWAAN